MKKFEIIIACPAPVPFAGAPDVTNPAYPSAAETILDAAGCVNPATIICLP